MKEKPKQFKYAKKIINAAGNEGTEVDKFAPKAPTFTLNF